MSGDPLGLDKICEILKQGKKEALSLLDKLSARLEGSGLQLLNLNGSYQLSTRKEYAPFVKALIEVKKNAPLSQAALEVLAVMAYNGAVTRSFIEQVRGVDSSGVIATLISRGLAEEAGRLDLPGRPLAYRTTENFLRCFSVANLGELPPLPTGGTPEKGR